MVCNVCGYANTENAPTCPICGNNLMQYSQQANVPPTAQPQPGPATQPQAQQTGMAAQPNVQAVQAGPVQGQPGQSQPTQAQAPQMQQPTPAPQPTPQFAQQQVPQYAQPAGNSPTPPQASADKKSKIILGSIIAAILVAAVILFVLVLGGKDEGTASNTPGTETAKSDDADKNKDGDKTDKDGKSDKDGDTTDKDADKDKDSDKNKDADGKDSVGVTDVTTISYMKRPSIIGDNMNLDYTEVQPSVPAQTLGDISELDNHEYIDYWDQDMKDMLMKNQFIVTQGYDYEFFESYEYNRYDYTPSFVTVDSIMHTYHLYFAHVLKNTEINYLSYDLAELGDKMQQKSEEQYQQLQGTEWEESAKLNLAYFTVGNMLMNPSAKVNPAVSDVVNSELALINEATQVVNSPLMPGSMEDYSQYKPRGYYEGDERLEKYFRAMMWYGRRNFTQNEEVLDRSALLMTLALDNETLPLWDEIYTVTSFFAGASDDSGYYEYKPIIESAYGANVTIADLPGNTAAWDTFHRLTGELEPPQINSVVVFQSDSDEERDSKILGYRFMGQRFSIDATIFQNLCYRNTRENPAGEKRMLPNALDVPAAMGSDEALTILDSMGETSYANYNENMAKMRDMVSTAPDSTWEASLYSQWLNTLRPLLDKKGEGYPTYMQSEEWQKKNLVTFLGSYTELKHDTILYSKQMMAEMGGGEIPVKDDRGYVEAEPLVYARLTGLVNATSSGLEGYGVLSAEDKENLRLLAEITTQLQVIAEKELRNELPTEAEFEFIRSYGGQLEHFWQEVNKDKASESPYGSLTTKEFPAAVVVDVATDPNGSCLELGTGRINDIIVVVTVDGVKKLAYGKVYSYYEFEQPLSDRLTDSEWKQMLGMELQSDNTYSDYKDRPKEVEWAKSYRHDND